MAELNETQVREDGNKLADLMSASNAGEAHVIYRDTKTGDVIGLLVIAQGDKAGDILAAIQDLMDGPWAKESGTERSVALNMSDVVITD